jgi:ubiquinone/menaquinone biosynthesis C-methylase UbiE
MQDVGSQIGYWDRVATEKRFSHPLRLDWLTRYSPSPEAKILDYGCGYGRTLSELSTSSLTNIFGVDFSQGMLARAHHEVPEARLVRNDGRNLPFRSESFDLVLLFAVLTCVPSDTEQRIVVCETERVLRPGGVVYISDLLINDDPRNRERYQQYADAYQCYGVFELPEGVVVRHHTVEWIEEVTGEFEKLEYEPFTVTTMNGNASAAFQYLGRKRA